MVPGVDVLHRLTHASDLDAKVSFKGRVLTDQPLILRGIETLLNNRLLLRLSVQPDIFHQLFDLFCLE